MGMPDNIFDWVDEETKAKAIAEAEAAYARGDFVEQDVARAWMMDLIDAIQGGVDLPDPPKPKGR